MRARLLSPSLTPRLPRSNDFWGAPLLGSSGAGTSGVRRRAAMPADVIECPEHFIMLVRSPLPPFAPPAS
jgi:hypothetical protein